MDDRAEAAIGDLLAQAARERREAAKRWVLTTLIVTLVFASILVAVRVVFGGFFGPDAFGD